MSSDPELHLQSVTKKRLHDGTILFELPCNILDIKHTDVYLYKKISSFKKKIVKKCYNDTCEIIIFDNHFHRWYYFPVR